MCCGGFTSMVSVNYRGRLPPGDMYWFLLLYMQSGGVVHACMGRGV